jgi:hypothetical protein
MAKRQKLYLPILEPFAVLTPYLTAFDLLALSEVCQQFLSFYRTKVLDGLNLREWLYVLQEQTDITLLTDVRKNWEVIAAVKYHVKHWDIWVLGLVALIVAKTTTPYSFPRYWTFKLNNGIKLFPEGRDQEVEIGNISQFAATPDWITFSCKTPSVYLPICWRSEVVEKIEQVLTQIVFSHISLEEVLKTICPEWKWSFSFEGKKHVYKVRGGYVPST